MPGQDRDSVVILYKGGRLPAWHQLTDEERSDCTQTHVDLMLSVADQFGIQRLEGFHLIGAQQDWQRFWLIEFPTLKGAEAWIEAEIAPPYGLYGYYEYYFSRQLQPEVFSAWVTDPAPSTRPRDVDPHTVPDLWINTESVVLLMFARYQAGSEALTPQERGDREHVALMQSIAGMHGLKRLEAFQLLTPQNDWHRAWIIELPTLEAAEAWVAGEESPPHGMYAKRTIYLARKWSPEYFASWVNRKS